MNIHNSVVVITGASSGIGKMMAYRFAHKGANVVLAARSADQLEAVAADLHNRGMSVLAVGCDVTSDADVERLFSTSMEAFGRIDLLVNNAGYGIFDPLKSAKPEDIRGMMEVNYFGAMRCLQAVLPIMHRQNSGHIINIASMAGLTSTQNMGAYAASKYALVAATQALQVELIGTPIQCSLVCPGPIDTPFFKRADFKKMSRFAKIFGTLKPETVADIVVHIAEHPTTLRMIPRSFYLANFAYRWVPAWTKYVLRWVG